MLSSCPSPSHSFTSLSDVSSVVTMVLYTEGTEVTTIRAVLSLVELTGWWRTAVTQCDPSFDREPRVLCLRVPVTP